MAGINFNKKNFNNNLNSLNAKANSNNNISKSASVQKKDDLKFKNQLDSDSFEFSGSKNNEDNNSFFVKQKTSSRKGGYWDRVNYYLGEGENGWAKSTGDMLNNDPLANNMAGNGRGAGAFSFFRTIVALIKAI